MIKKGISILLSMAIPIVGFADNPKSKSHIESLQGLDFNSVALLIWDGKSLKLEYDGHYYELEHSDECGCKYRDEDESRD